MNSQNTAFTTEQIYQNLMELLVQEEIEKQLKPYPKQIKSSLNRVEIEAYALNRLPTLYASSEKGRDHQKQLGQQKYQKEITMAVRRALAMVEQNPNRNLSALVAFSDIEAKCQEAQKALQRLQKLLIQTQLIENSQSETTWDNLVSVVQQALKRLYWKEKQQHVQLQLPPKTTDDQVSLGWDSDFIV